MEKNCSENLIGLVNFSKTERGQCVCSLTATIEDNCNKGLIYFIFIYINGVQGISQIRGQLLFFIKHKSAILT